jgi:hypothetical protein
MWSTSYLRWLGSKFNFQEPSAEGVLFSTRNFLYRLLKPKDNSRNPIMRLMTRKTATTTIDEAIVKTTKVYDIKPHLLMPIERIVIALLQNLGPTERRGQPWATFYLPTKLVGDCDICDVPSGAG